MTIPKGFKFPACPYCESTAITRSNHELSCAKCNATFEAPAARKAGQPKRGSGSVPLTVSVAIEEKELFEKMAAQMSLTPSAFFRHVFDVWHTKYQDMLPKTGRGLIGSQEEKTEADVDLGRQAAQANKR